MVNKKQPRSARTSTRKRDERREQARAIARAEQARADAAEKERVRVQEALDAEQARILAEAVARLNEVHVAGNDVQDSDDFEQAPDYSTYDGCGETDYAEEDDSEPEGEGEEDDDFDCTRVHRSVLTMPRPRTAGTRRFREP